MLKQLKTLGTGASSALAVCAVIGGLVSFFGGHMPPWPSYAWGATIEDATKQNSQSIAQLNALVLSQKVAELQEKANANPRDVFIQQELRYWSFQLQQAEAALLKRK